MPKLHSSKQTSPREDSDSPFHVKRLITPLFRPLITPLLHPMSLGSISNSKKATQASLPESASSTRSPQESDHFTNTIFGEIQTSGVSEQLARNDGFEVGGVEGSKKFAQKDWGRIQQYAKRFKEIGHAHGIPGALLAAIASRESRGGLLLNDAGYGLYDPNGYGLMQIDKVANASLTSDDPYSKEHIETATKFFVQLLQEVKTKHPDWSKAWQLRGAIAAYNFGSDDVVTKEGIDKGTTGNDYSADIWERARYFASMKEFADGSAVALSEERNSGESDWSRWFESFSLDHLWNAENEEPETIEYSVKEKETPDSIAKHYGISKEELLAINKDKVKTWGTVQGFNKGEKIKIPLRKRSLLEQGWEATKSVSSGIWEQTKDLSQSTWNSASDLGQEALEGAKNLSEKAWEGSKSGAEATGNWVKSWFEEEKETKREVPQTSAPAPKLTSPANHYLSQRDNTFTSTWEDMYGMTGDNKVSADNECNVTALAMALTRVEKYETLVSNAVALLQEYGNTEKAEVLQKQQLEDLILKLFQQIGYDYFAEDLRRYLGKEDNWELPAPPHQFARALGNIGTKILGKGHSTNGGELLTKSAYLNIKPKLKGAGIILGTDLTSSGHVVTLVDIMENGILIDDPYGTQYALQGQYLRNGALLSNDNVSHIKSNLAHLQKKLEYSPEIQKFVGKIDEKDIGKLKLPNNMGERNFYTWKQVSTYRIGWYYQLIR